MQAFREHKADRGLTYSAFELLSADMRLRNISFEVDYHSSDPALLSCTLQQGLADIRHWSFCTRNLLRLVRVCLIPLVPRSCTPEGSVRPVMSNDRAL